MAARKKHLRSKETPLTRGRTRTSRRARLLAGNVTRTVVLIAIVLGTGAAAGLAVAYPLRSLDLGGSDAVTLDQEALAGTIDAEQALVAQADLPKSYVLADDSVTAGVALIGAKYCGIAATPDAVVGDPLTRAFLDNTNHALILSEVVKVKQPNDAGKYIKELTRVFDGCPGQKYFTAEGPDQQHLEITHPRNDEPLELDYLTRTLTPVDGGTTQIVTYFEVGNVVVAIQYAGPQKPSKDLMAKAEDEILYRVAPDQFSKTAKVKGEKPLPEETTTTTIPDVVQPSPTSSPPTLAPDPTFEPPTTTTKKRTTTTKKPTTTVAPTAPPAGQ
jgi:hypothetical protein